MLVTAFPCSTRKGYRTIPPRYSYTPDVQKLDSDIAFVPCIARYRMRNRSVPSNRSAHGSKHRKRLRRGGSHGRRLHRDRPALRRGSRTVSLRSSRTAIEFLTGMGARAGEGGSHAPHPWTGEMYFKIVCPYLTHGLILGLRWRGTTGGDRRCFGVTGHLASHRVRLVSCNPLLQQVFH